MTTKRPTAWSLGTRDFSVDDLPVHLQSFTGIRPVAATVDPEVGQEALLLVRDESLKAADFENSPSFRLDVTPGLVSTEEGPVAFLIFLLSTGGDNGEPFGVYENLFDPKNAGQWAPYRELSLQSHWHMHVLGKNDQTVAMVELENVFGLEDDLPPILNETGKHPEGNFERALGLVMDRYELIDLWKAGRHEALSSTKNDPGYADLILMEHTEQRESVERGDTSRFVDTIETLNAQPDGGRSRMGSLGLTIRGYEDDPRELWQIPAVRSWCAKLMEEVPEMMFFLSPEAKTTKLMMLCTVPVEHDGPGVIRVDNENVTDWLMRAYETINLKVEELGMRGDAPELMSLSKRFAESLYA